MARKRASMREGPLAELFKATEAAQRQAGPQADDLARPPNSSAEGAGGEAGPPTEPFEETVPHVPEWETPAAAPPPRAAPPPSAPPPSAAPSAPPPDDPLTPPSGREPE